MKIAIYQPRASYYVGGGEVVPLEHARYLSLRGHNVTFLTTRAHFIRESELFRTFKEDNPSVRVEYINVPPRMKAIYKNPPGLDWSRWHDESFQVGRLAQEWLRDRTFDAVAVHNVVDSVAIPVGQKSVLHLHGYPSELGDLQRVCLSIPDFCIAVSKYIKEKWLGFSVIKRCDVAHNGIDSTRFELGKGVSREFDVVYAGRLLPIKGVEYLLESILILVEQGVKVKVAIVGDGPDRQRLERLAAKLKLGKSVKFLGRVDDDHLLGIYQNSKIAVLPSYDREGVLTTMLEAAACGVPTITTTACSMKEFITDKVNGLLVKPKDADEIACAVKKLLGDDDLRVRLGKAARKKAVATWSWEKQIVKVEKIYEKAANPG